MCLSGTPFDADCVEGHDGARAMSLLQSTLSAPLSSRRISVSADPIIYCLESLTDYRQFERLCSDLMSVSGYTDIEPLGGASDRGRDAIFVGEGSEAETTIFAYSVRADWKTKLREDLARIKSEDHEVSSLIFATTATISSTERDTAVADVADRMGWRLHLYGLERLRVRFSGDARHLVAQHPAVFSPPFFPRRGGLSVSASRDTILIDHVASDHALATWLARRLQLLGFRTWCYGTAPLAGQDADQSVRALIEERAIRYIPILSDASIRDADFAGRCGAAAGREAFVLPCRSGPLSAKCLPSPLRRMTPCSFEEHWSVGIASLLKALEDGGVHPTLDVAHGRSAALRALAPVPVVKEAQETVYTNTFSMRVPDVLRVYRPAESLDRAGANNLKRVWPHIEVSDGRLLAFEGPPPATEGAVSATGAGFTWRGSDLWEGLRSQHLVRRLLYRAIDVACFNAGLEWCVSRKKFHFPPGPNPQHKIKFEHVDGRKTYAALNGEISWGSGDRAKPFRYQVCPAPRVTLDPSGQWWLTMRLYVRVTEKDGTPFERKHIGRRRKKVTKSWWNNKWLAKTLAMMRGLSMGEDEVCIGSGSAAVRVSVWPERWNCPVSLDYEAMETLGDFQGEMTLRTTWSEDGLNDAE